MSELPSDFDLHEFLNNGIKDEFSPILNELKEKDTWTSRRENINAILENYFESKTQKSVSAS